MNAKRVCLVVSCVLATELAVATASADAPDQKAAAQALFEEGRAAVDAGKFAEACPKFAESQRLDPGLGTLLWLADCYENNGQTATAWGAFKEAAAIARLRSDARQQVAIERAAALEAHLSRLTILAPSGAVLAGLDVRRDGLPVASLLWGEPIPVDPGPHTIDVRAPGKKEWSTVVEIPVEPSTIQVIVPALVAEKTLPPVTVVPWMPTPPPASHTQRWVGIGVGAVGLVALGFGTYASFSAKATYDNATREGHCSLTNVCDQEGARDRQRAFDEATASTITFVAGAIAVAGGIVLVVTAPH
jgi:hypothetical protein